jgi:hypothetical protein
MGNSSDGHLIEYLPPMACFAVSKIDVRTTGHGNSEAIVIAVYKSISL